jgi:hypothetical protein
LDMNYPPEFGVPFCRSMFSKVGWEFGLIISSTSKAYDKIFFSDIWMTGCWGENVKDQRDDNQSVSPAVCSLKAFWILSFLAEPLLCF